MTAFDILVIDPTDLAEMSLVCPKCETRITVNMEARLVDQCPSCRVGFDQAVVHAQRAFQQFRSALAVSGIRIQFPISRRRPEPPESTS
jgi:hypothetical protein